MKISLFEIENLPVLVPTKRLNGKITEYRRFNSDQWMLNCASEREKEGGKDKERGGRGTDRERDRETGTEEQRGEPSFLEC